MVLFLHGAKQMGYFESSVAFCMTAAGSEVMMEDAKMSVDFSPRACS